MQKVLSFPKVSYFFSKYILITDQSAGNYMLKVNNRKTIKWRRSGIFIVSFERISHIDLVFLLLTLSK